MLQVNMTDAGGHTCRPRVCVFHTLLRGRDLRWNCCWWWWMPVNETEKWDIRGGISDIIRFVTGQNLNTSHATKACHSNKRLQAKQNLGLIDRWRGGGLTNENHAQISGDEGDWGWWTSSELRTGLIDSHRSDSFVKSDSTEPVCELGIQQSIQTHMYTHHPTNRPRRSEICLSRWTYSVKTTSCSRAIIANCRIPDHL